MTTEVQDGLTYSTIEIKDYHMQVNEIVVHKSHLDTAGPSTIIGRV